MDTELWQCLVGLVGWKFWLEVEMAQKALSTHCIKKSNLLSVWGGECLLCENSREHPTQDKSVRTGKRQVFRRPVSFSFNRFVWPELRPFIGYFWLISGAILIIENEAKSKRMSGGLNWSPYNALSNSFFFNFPASPRLARYMADLWPKTTPQACDLAVLGFGTKNQFF